MTRTALRVLLEKSREDALGRNTGSAIEASRSGRPGDMVDISTSGPPGVSLSGPEEAMDTTPSSLPDANESEPDEIFNTSISELPDVNEVKSEEYIEAPTSVIDRANETKAVEPKDTASSSHLDKLDLVFIDLAASKLPVTYLEVMLAAIDLQKKFNASRVQDEGHEKKEHESKGRYENEGLGENEGIPAHEIQPVNHEGQGRDQGGLSAAQEPQLQSPRGGVEPGDDADADMDGEPRIDANDAARLHGLRILWYWVRMGDHAKDVKNLRCETAINVCGAGMGTEGANIEVAAA
jgi:hypothetical protein